MYKTLERITHNGSRVLNRYSLRANSHLYISLPNGDDLRLYASEDGNYVSIAVETHRQTGRLETDSVNSDFDDFTTQRERIETNIDSRVWTEVEFTAYYKKETEEQS